MVTHIIVNSGVNIQSCDCCWLFHWCGCGMYLKGTTTTIYGPFYAVIWVHKSKSVNTVLLCCFCYCAWWHFAKRDRNTDL